MHYFTFLFFVFLILGGGDVAFASTADAVNLLIQATEPQRRQRDFLDEQDRLLKEVQPPPAIPSGIETEDLNSAPMGPDTGVCLPVEKVVFEKATVFPIKRLQGNVPAKSCLSLQDIFGLVRETTNLYVSAGYVTSRAYLPEQDLSSGQLRIEVVEGRVEAVELYQNGKKRLTGGSVLPDLNGKILHIRSIEQGLDQINRLASKDAKISFRPGSKHGTSIVIVDITAGRPWQARVGVDNSGSESTGKAQLEGSFTLEDFFGQFETISILHKRSDPTLDESRLSGNTSFSISVPKGNWTARWNSSFYNYVSELISQTQTFETSGTNWSHTAEVERLLHRDQVSKTFGRASLNFKEAKNFFEDALLEVSSRILSIFRLELAHSRRAFGGSLSGKTGWYQGLPAFGAPRDERVAPGSPRAQFSKFDGEVSYLTGASLGSNYVAFSTRLRGQYTPDALFGSEQLGIGGVSSVRGFDADSLSVENGLYTRNEISLTPKLFSEEQAKYLGQLSLFAGLDSGWQLPSSSTLHTYENIVGAAVGARLIGGIFYGEISYERPLSAPSFFSGDPVLRLRAGVVLNRF